MPVAAFYTFLINAIRFNLFFNLALFDCADENLILQLKFVSREIFEKCDWRRSSYEATRRMCNCSGSKNDLNRVVWCIGASLTIGSRRSNFVSRSDFFTRYRSRACGVKTGYVATGTAEFITTVRICMVRSRELCKLRILHDWAVCIASKIFYSNFYKDLSCY